MGWRDSVEVFLNLEQGPRQPSKQPSLMYLKEIKQDYYWNCPKMPFCICHFANGELDQDISELGFPKRILFRSFNLSFSIPGQLWKDPVGDPAFFSSPIEFTQVGSFRMKRMS